MTVVTGPEVGPTARCWPLGTLPELALAMEMVELPESVTARLPTSPLVSVELPETVSLSGTVAFAEFQVSRPPPSPEYWLLSQLHQLAAQISSEPSSDIGRGLNDRPFNSDDSTKCRNSSSTNKPLPLSRGNLNMCLPTSISGLNLYR